MPIRDYTSRRIAIADALVTELKTINGSVPFVSNLDNNVSADLKFWDEMVDFPVVFVTPGTETREYQGGQYKDRFMNMAVRIYVNEDEPMSALEALIEDVETVIETNSRLTYVDRSGDSQTTHLISILTIETDEGVLAPLGVGQILIEVRY